GDGVGQGGNGGGPGSGSKKFDAEAGVAEVSSVMTVMAVTSMSLTPRLKRVWRRINKGSPDSRADDPRAHHPSITLGGGRKYDLSVPGVRRLGHSGLSPVNFTTLPHFSVSSAMS